MKLKLGNKLNKQMSWLKKLKKYQLAGLIAIAAIFTYGVFTVFAGLPSPGKLGSDQFPVSTQIMDRNGTLLYEIYTDQNRTPIKIEELPKYIPQATIAIEDKNFYKHHGFAWEGITRALVNTIFKRNLQGGSTITQQLIKTTLLSPERTITRKIREGLLAIATEVRYQKDDILEMYLNHVPYGGTAYGIEQASQTYFGKRAQDLTLPEAALLAGLPQAPTRYSPFGANPEIAEQRQEQVLKRMLEDKYIDQGQFDEAVDSPLNYIEQTNNLQAAHFSLYVKQILVDKYGETLVEKGGLRVTTSLDLNLQNFAQDTVATEVAKLNKANVSNGAAMITKPRTGEILAMVGSRDYFDPEIDGNVNLTTSLRQPGSSIKPINYSVGLANGFTPATMFLDVPTCFSVPGQPSYCPKNYDGSFHGPVQMRFALGNSFNIPAVKMLAANGVETMIASASAMGITTFQDPSRYGLSLTLGGGEVRMIDMAVAFGVFSNQGLKVDLTPILKVETYQGKVLEEVNFEDSVPVGEKVVDPENAYLISHILLDNNARSQAFGPTSQLVIPNHAVSVKTGTTDDLRDNWTIGFTPTYLVTTWVGNNDNKPMSPYLVSGISGAAPIWNKIMREVLKDQPDEWPTKPENVIGMEICSLTGYRPHPEHPCEAKRFEYFIKGHEPDVEPNLKQTIVIDKTTGLPPTASGSAIPENLEQQEHVVLSDPVQKDYCLDCSRPLNDKGEPQEAAYQIRM